MLEEDQRADTTPSSRQELDDPARGAVVLDLARVARAGGSPSARPRFASAPRRRVRVDAEVADESISCGFFFAPMIPLSDGKRGSLIASDTATTAGSGASITS